jgi:ATP-dependent DNA ligase
MVDFIELMDPKILKIEKSEQFFEDSSWILERKYNGRRIQCLNINDISFAGRYARTGNENISSFSWKFSRISDELRSLNLPKYTLFDGEVYLPGRPISYTMQMINSDVNESIRLQEHHGHLHYVIFDVLAFDGEFLVNKSLLNRRSRLVKCLSSKLLFNVKLVEQYKHTHEKNKLWKNILNSDDDEKGVVFKFQESEYESGRSKWWRKLKKTETYDGVILNFKLHNNYPEDFVTSIEIGQYRRGRLTKVASIAGLTKEQASEFRSNMKKYIGLVVQFKSELKTDSSYKTARFDRLRYDKRPQSCIWEE